MLNTHRSAISGRGGACPMTKALSPLCPHNHIVKRFKYPILQSRKLRLRSRDLPKVTQLRSCETGMKSSLYVRDLRCAPTRAGQAWLRGLSRVAFPGEKGKQALCETQALSCKREKRKMENFSSEKTKAQSAPLWCICPLQEH